MASAVSDVAGPVMTHDGHACTSPGLNTVVAPSTCELDTAGRPARKSTPVSCLRTTVTGMGSRQYPSGAMSVSTGLALRHISPGSPLKPSS